MLPKLEQAIAVHDCWSSYWKYDNVEHAVCCAHLLRELEGVKENEPNQQWAPQFTELLLEMKKAKETAIGLGKTELERTELEAYERRYAELMALADRECPAPPKLQEKKRGRRKRGPVRALIERLQTLKDSVCLFVHNFAVPFDNNQAERDVRNIKTKAKVAGCFRSKKGAENYTRLMSYISTGQKHGISAYKALTEAFCGNADIILG